MSFKDEVNVDITVIVISEGKFLSHASTIEMRGMFI